MSACLLPDKDFAGWSVDGKAYRPGDRLTVQGNTEIVAQWSSPESLLPMLIAATLLLIVAGSAGAFLVMRKRAQS